MDDNWAGDMHVMFQLVEMLPECTIDFSTAAANLFFKIAKNHRRYDGNKRSAICCLVFLVALNNQKSSISGQEIEDLVLEVAASHGNTGDQLVPRLRDFFKKKITPIQ